MGYSLPPGMSRAQTGPGWGNAGVPTQPTGQTTEDVGLTSHGHPVQSPKPLGTKTNNGFSTANLGHDMNPSQVRSMQQFLVNHGFQLTVDGVLGPLTQSAAAAFRSNHKGGEDWNKSHGIGVHPVVKGTAPHGNAGDAAATGTGGDPR